MDEFVTKNELISATYHEDLQAALGSANAKEDHSYVYSIENETFVWKKRLAGEVVVKLGEIKLKEVPVTATFEAGLSKAVKRYKRLEEILTTLKKRMKTLESSREEMLRRLCQESNLKDEMERSLYAKFLAVLNKKKERMRALKEAMETVNPGSGILDLEPPRPGPSRSESSPSGPSGPSRPGPSNLESSRPGPSHSSHPEPSSSKRATPSPEKRKAKHLAEKGDEDDDDDPYAADTDVDSDEDALPETTTPTLSVAARRGNAFDSFDSPTSPVALLPKRSKLMSKLPAAAVPSGASGARGEARWRRRGARREVAEEARLVLPEPSTSKDELDTQNIDDILADF